MKIVILLVGLLAVSAQAEEKKRKVIYEYKKFEKFDFEEIGVEGEAGSPGDLSVAPTPRKDYGNRLPERKDFLPEMRNSASGIR